LARKSKRPLRPGFGEQSNVTFEVFKTVIYARLSYKSDRQEGSITHQVAMGQEYIRNHPNLELTNIYIDNGRTGTNFDRSGFQAMLAAVDKGEIERIIIKDVSRLGRNFLETSEYLEHYFPSKGVEVIELDDKTQGMDGGNLNRNIKVLFDSIYPDDTRKKVIKSLELCKQQGKRIAGFAIYGYVYDKNTERFSIDDPAADVVRLIFRRYLQNGNLTWITRELNERGIQTPAARLDALRIRKRRDYGTSDGWTNGTIRTILKNSFYMGDEIGNQYEGKKRKPESEWIVTHNAHPVIVSNEDFQAAQEIFRQNREKFQPNPPKRHAPSPLSGLLICQECGHRLQIVHLDDRGNVKLEGFWAQCAVCHDSKGSKRFRVAAIEAAAVKAVGDQLTRYEKYMASISAALQTPKVKKRRGLLEQELWAVTAAISGVTDRAFKLYDGFTDGEYSDEEYHQRDQSLRSERDCLNRRKEELTDDLQALDPSYWTNLPVSVAVKQTSAFETLSREKLNAFISRVLVRPDGSAFQVELRFADDIARMGAWLKNWAAQTGEAVGA
jgi:DNA invertase Pin-like site-specific DNA recombinase